jgi:hypothetical protein
MKKFITLILLLLTLMSQADAASLVCEVSERGKQVLLLRQPYDQFDSATISTAIKRTSVELEVRAQETKVSLAVVLRDGAVLANGERMVQNRIFNSNRVLDVSCRVE